MCAMQAIRLAATLLSSGWDQDKAAPPVCNQDQLKSFSLVAGTATEGSPTAANASASISFPSQQSSTCYEGLNCAEGVEGDHGQILEACADLAEKVCIRPPKTCKKFVDAISVS
jgi:hypothetical protein